jgi:hypothetical protein
VAANRSHRWDALEHGSVSVAAAGGASGPTARFVTTTSEVTPPASAPNAARQSKNEMTIDQPSSRSAPTSKRLIAPQSAVLRRTAVHSIGSKCSKQARFVAPSRAASRDGLRDRAKAPHGAAKRCIRRLNASAWAWEDGQRENAPNVALRRAASRGCCAIPGKSCIAGRCISAGPSQADPKIRDSA